MRRRGRGGEGARERRKTKKGTNALRHCERQLKKAAEVSRQLEREGVKKSGERGKKVHFSRGVLGKEHLRKPRQEKLCVFPLIRAARGNATREKGKKHTGKWCLPGRTKGVFAGDSHGHGNSQEKKQDNESFPKKSGTRAYC